MAHEREIAVTLGPPQQLLPSEVPPMLTKQGQPKISTADASGYRGELFKGRNKQHYWKLVRVRGGKSVAVGGEGYVRPSGAAKAFEKLFPGVPLAQ
jgi:hypothetical protein